MYLHDLVQFYPHYVTKYVARLPIYFLNSKCLIKHFSELNINWFIFQIRKNDVIR